MSYRRSHRIKRKKSKLKKVLPLLILISFFVFIVYFLFFSDFFTFKKIIIFGNIKVSQEDLLVVIQKETQAKKFQVLNNSLLLFDLNATENNILSSFPLISSVRITKKFPNTINVSISERVGKAVFCDFFEEKILG